MGARSRSDLREGGILCGRAALARCNLALGNADAPDKSLSSNVLGRQVRKGYERLDIARRTGEMSDLVAIAFPTEAAAEEVRKKLLDMQHEYLIELGMPSLR